MNKVCEKCSEGFKTRIHKQIYCDECRKELICCIEGCENEVKITDKLLCGKHYTQYKRAQKEKPDRFCRHCEKKISNPDPFRQDYCVECKELKENLICCVDGCCNKSLSFNNRKCGVHSKKRNSFLKECVICNKEFMTPMFKKNCCSRECNIKLGIKRAVQKNREEAQRQINGLEYYVCEVCNKEFKPARLCDLKQHCCSKECRKIYSNNEAIKHYREKLKPGNHLCRGKSFPQQFIFDILNGEFNNLKWEYNNRRVLKNPDSNKCLEIDIWCPEIKLAIEFDGKQHFEPKYGQEVFEYTVKMDKLKEKLCKELNIQLVRINYEDDWKNKEWVVNKIGETINVYI